MSAGGNEYALVSDFQFKAEERVAEAVAEVFAAAFAGEADCGIALGLVAEATPLRSNGRP